MGAPRSFPPGVVVEVKALACELPATLGVPLSRLHVPDIRAEAIARGLVASISATTIWRWLSEDAIKPWQHRSWIFPRDLDFERKAGVVLDLYHRTFEGQPLRANEYVLSADEKTPIQARCRCHPTLPPPRRGPCASSTSMIGVGRCNISPHGTAITPSSSGAANLIPGLRPSTGWWTKS